MGINGEIFFFFFIQDLSFFKIVLTDLDALQLKD